MVMITGRTDRQTDRQTDRVRRNMRPPPREEGRITINKHEHVTDLLSADWMYSVQLGQLRRRVLKFSEPPTNIVGDGHRPRRSVVEGVHSATTQLN